MRREGRPRPVYGGFREAPRAEAPIEGLRCRAFTHDCGLRLCVWPKKGFRRKFASFGIPFGSVHQTAAAGERPVLPGTAHYLEHCIFSRDEEGGLMGRLGALGCQANAYTTHTETVYYFSAGEHFARAFLDYFDALLRPSFADERVEAERGIICAELAMYMDMPEALAYKKLMERLYLVHGAKEDIGGTPDSVSAIRAEDLRRVWRRHYSPRAMRLTLAGDFGEEELGALLAALDGRLAAEDWPKPPRPLRLPEPAAVREPRLELRAEVENRSFLLAVKDPHPFWLHPLSGREQALRALSANLLLDSLLGEAAPLYEQLYEEGWLNESFSLHYVCEQDFAYLLMSGEAEDPRAAAQKLFGALCAALADEALGGDIFPIQKKAALGHYLRALDEVESLGMSATQALLTGLMVGDYANIIDQASMRRARADLAFVADAALRVEVDLYEKES